MCDGSAEDKARPAVRDESWQVRRAVPAESVQRDEDLLAALARAVRAREAVPPSFIQAARDAYAWHNVDYELAQLTYDSSRYADATRAETASIRALTFRSAKLTIDLEVIDDSLVGQVIPAHEHPVEIQTAGGTSQAAIDEFGCFQITPVPQDQFRLHCQAADGTDVLTGWITL